MIRVPFNDDWTVGPKLGAFEAMGAESAALPVTLPHDAQRDLPRSADSDQGVHAAYHPGGVFEYAKTFDVPAEWREKTVIVEFEGVYRDAVVFVNGEFAAHQANGYAAFAVTLDPFLRFGEPNRITVEARAHKDSRWYTGAGIYRPVHLLVAGPTHIALDGTRITTPDIDDERAVISVATTVENASRHTSTTRIAWSVVGPDGTEVAATSAPVTVLPGDASTARVRLSVAAPQLWHPDSPRLYSVTATLTDLDGTVIDEETTSFGIRRLQLDTGPWPAHQRADREAARRVRAPRQRSARRRHDRRRRGPSRAPDESCRLQRAAQRAQSDEPGHARRMRSPRRAGDG